MLDLRSGLPVNFVPIYRFEKYRYTGISFLNHFFLAGTSHLSLSNFTRLVLGCIKTKFCKKICVWQHFSRSTRFAYFCTAAISKFSQKIGLKNQHFLWKFSQNFANVAKFAKFAKFQKIQLDNLVDFEKCCRTHIYLQKSVPIQPKTSEILPKFCQKLATCPLQPASVVFLSILRAFTGPSAAAPRRAVPPGPSKSVISPKLYGTPYL